MTPVRLERIVIFFWVLMLPIENGNIQSYIIKNPQPKDCGTYWFSAGPISLHINVYSLLFRTNWWILTKLAYIFLGRRGEVDQILIKK